MGILNVTPDSFSDGGRYAGVSAAVEHALQMAAHGADIIDVGGESTRPGAQPVPVQEELDRVLPVVEAIRARVDVPVSVDTSKPDVMLAAAAAGAAMLNDVRAFSLPGAMDAAARTGLAVCVMHMQGEPATMQASPHYDDVVSEVLQFLTRRVAELQALGIPAGRIVLDPGFGFGKTLRHNLALLRGLDRLVGTGYPVLVGVSRKSLVGALLADPERDRLIGSVTLALYAARQGAHIVRVHDVRETVEALRIESGVAGIH